jgi:hypothetical protein
MMWQMCHVIDFIVQWYVSYLFFVFFSSTNKFFSFFKFTFYSIYISSVVCSMKVGSDWLKLHDDWSWPKSVKTNFQTWPNHIQLHTTGCMRFGPVFSTQWIYANRLRFRFKPKMGKNQTRPDQIRPLNTTSDSCLCHVARTFLLMYVLYNLCHLSYI